MEGFHTNHISEGDPAPSESVPPSEEETQSEESNGEDENYSQVINQYKKGELVSIYGSPHMTFKIIDFKKDEMNIYPENNYNYVLELVEGTFVQDTLPCIPEYLLVRK